MPASFSVMPKSVASNVFLGKFCVKLCTCVPLSSASLCATSNSVASAGNVFVSVPPGICSRSRASVYALAGLEEDAAGAGVAEEEGAAAEGGSESGGGSVWPVRAAFSSSALRRRSALSASTLARTRFLASSSACFSRRLAAASLSCSFFCRSSRMSWDSLVVLRRIS